MDCRVCKGTTPLCLQIGIPFLYKIRVGTPLTCNSEASALFWSTSIFIIRIASPMLARSCSKIGAIVLQGPHQLAVKSTRTGLGPLITDRKVSFSAIIIKRLFDRADFCWLPKQGAYKCNFHNHNPTETGLPILNRWLKHSQIIYPD